MYRRGDYNIVNLAINEEVGDGPEKIVRSFPEACQVKASMASQIGQAGSGPWPISGRSPQDLTSQHGGRYRVPLHSKLYALASSPKYSVNHV